MIKIFNTNIKVINLYILKGPLFNECSVVVAASIKICAPSHTNDALS